MSALADRLALYEGSGTVPLPVPPHTRTPIPPDWDDLPLRQMSPAAQRPVDPPWQPEIIVQFNADMQPIGYIGWPESDVEDACSCHTTGYRRCPDRAHYARGKAEERRLGRRARLRDCEMFVAGGALGALVFGVLGRLAA